MTVPTTQAARHEAGTTGYAWDAVVGTDAGNAGAVASADGPSVPIAA